MTADTRLPGYRNRRWATEKTCIILTLFVLEIEPKYFTYIIHIRILYMQDDSIYTKWFVINSTVGKDFIFKNKSKICKVRFFLYEASFLEENLESYIFFFIFSVLYIFQWYYIKKRCDGY